MTFEYDPMIRRVIHEVLITSPEREPPFLPLHLINNALCGRRKKRTATKDRSAVKAARKQRHRK